jgi:hypothetical protein
MGYRDSVNKAMTTISTAAAGAQAKIDVFLCCRAGIIAVTVTNYLPAF